MTNLERLKYIINCSEDYNENDIADFLTYLILDSRCENFDDILKNLLDNYLD